MLRTVGLDVWMNLSADFPNMEVLKTVLLSPASHNCLLRHNVGPEGRPQHCCAWLGAACSFPKCASVIIPEEVIRAVHYFQPAPFFTDLDVTHTHSDESKLLQLQFSLEQWTTLPAGSERLPVHTAAS